MTLYKGQDPLTVNGGGDIDFISFVLNFPVFQLTVMMKSNEPVNQKVMDVISTHLGENWRTLFRSLNYSDGQIDQMKEDYYISGVKEVIYRLLLDYSRNNDDASLGHITKAMWKLGFKECVKILKIHWKCGDLVTTETSSGSDEASCSKGKSVD